NKDWPEPQKGHAAMITRMDRDIGTIFKKLKELGIDENTLVLFSSDNGPHKEGMGDPLFFNSAGKVRGMKRDLYEGGIRVPMIARWPGKIKPGTTSALPSAFWDFLPTACDVAGIENPQNIDGISYLPAMLGKTNKKHDVLYWEFPSQGGKQALRWGDWKAVRLHLGKRPNGPLELYNLKTDPREKNNVAALHPDIVKKMETMMREEQSNNVAG
ncbi:sulfatase-like hydrolase/transferase, partial [bacterium]|nr:sulfatase-like hydrolase/transferase [bacterium]